MLNKLKRNFKVISMFFYYFLAFSVSMNARKICNLIPKGILNLKLDTAQGFIIAVSIVIFFMSISYGLYVFIEYIDKKINK